MNATGSVWRTVWLALSLTLVGCQSYDEGVRVICESAAAVGGEDLDPPARASAASVWVSQHLENPDARMFFRALAPLPPERKAAAVRAVAAEAGITDCPLADVWETPPDERAPSAQAAL